MKIVEKANFSQTYDYLRSQLLVAPKVDVGKWQSQDISNQPLLVTHEVQDVHLSFAMPRSYDDLVADVKPNLPWAEDHMRERVCGVPLNPPPSASWWPYAQKDNDEHKEGKLFSHTYPERFWPKFAATGTKAPNGRLSGVPHMGIRYELGDLGNLVELLRAEPYTRQAYLPVWFPEDTGNASGVRVPCTLGYHFMYRDGKFNMTYFIRSCDFVRHFRDDVYMALRLGEWLGYNSDILADKEDGGLEGDLGKFTMVIPSLHCFDGDIAKLRYEEGQAKGFEPDSVRLLKAFS